MLITLDGCSGVGKTTVTDFLVREHGFAELPFNRQFQRAMDSITPNMNHLRDNSIIQAATAFNAFREAADIERAYEGKFVCDHFWEPAFFRLYMDDVAYGTTIFPAMTETFQNYMIGFRLGCSVLSLWLDAPYIESCRRAAHRDSKTPKPNIQELDCWRNFAFQLTNQLPYFRIIDATQSAQSVQRSVTRILEDNS